MKRGIKPRRNIKEYFSNKSPIDLKIKVITESEKNNIVGEYNEIYENGKAEGMQQGVKQGIKQGMKQGMLKVLIDMVKDKLLSVADAAKRLGVSEKEFMRISKA